MKTLTLTQPWATLVAIEAKKIETRSWRTSYRGRIAIHAAKGFPRSARDFHYAMVAQQFNLPIETVPLGSVIATAWLAQCLPVHCIFEADLTEQEKAFGDFSEGRYGWFLQDIVVLPEPIPAKGALSLWEWAAPEGIVG